MQADASGVQQQRPPLTTTRSLPLHPSISLNAINLSRCPRRPTALTARARRWRVPLLCQLRVRLPVLLELGSPLLTHARTDARFPPPLRML